jgi:hypothetical protein
VFLDFPFLITPSILHTGEYIVYELCLSWEVNAQFKGIVNNRKLLFCTISKDLVAKHKNIIVFIIYCSYDMPFAKKKKKQKNQTKTRKKIEKNKKWKK